MSSAMRRAIILLLLAIGTGLLAACGKSSHPPAITHTAAVTQTSPAPNETLTKARALAFARAVNLSTGDVPGFTASSERERVTPLEKRLEREMLRCAGSIGSGKALAEVSSNDFELKHDILDLGVSSKVGVAQTSAAAASELAAIRGVRVRACFSRYLGLLFKGQRFAGATISPVSIQSGTPPAPGTKGSFAWRVTVTFTVHRIRVSLYLDILGFVAGPARVTLFSSGALRPFPAAIQQRLFSLLLARAEAHAL
jgi:hypothetical protein